MRPCDDPLYDSNLEDEILASALGGVKIRSLPVEAFTSDLRRAIYRLLCQDVRPEAINAHLVALGYDHLDRGKLGALLSLPSLPTQAIKEGVAQLKRLAQMRDICRVVDGWRQMAVTLEPAVAVGMLHKVVEQLRKEYPPT
jgi:hypothetical protein